MKASTAHFTATPDPVTAALADPDVNRRLLAAAKAILGRGGFSSGPTQATAEAEEVVSVAQARSLEHRSHFDPDREVVRWLIGFVRNVAREHTGNRGFRCVELPPDAPKLEDLAADVGLPFVDSIANKEFVDRLLAQVTPDEAKLLRLKYEDDLTFAEIAVRVGSTENAVRVRHHRLIGRLRQLSQASGEVRP